MAASSRGSVGSGLPIVFSTAERNAVARLKGLGSSFDQIARELLGRSAQECAAVWHEIQYGGFPKEPNSPSSSNSDEPLISKHERRQQQSAQQSTTNSKTAAVPFAWMSASQRSNTAIPANAKPSKKVNGATNSATTKQAEKKAHKEMSAPSQRWEAADTAQVKSLLGAGTPPSDIPGIMDRSMYSVNLCIAHLLRKGEISVAMNTVEHQQNQAPTPTPSQPPYTAPESSALTSHDRPSRYSATCHNSRAPGQDYKVFADSRQNSTGLRFNNFGAPFDSYSTQSTLASSTTTGLSQEVHMASPSAFYGPPRSSATAFESKHDAKAVIEIPDDTEKERQHSRQLSDKRREYENLLRMKEIKDMEAKIAKLKNELRE